MPIVSTFQGTLCLGVVLVQRIVHGYPQRLAQTPLMNSIQFGPGSQGGFDHLWVPLSSGSATQNSFDFMLGASLTIRSVARHGIERVGHGQDTRDQRDLVALEAGGVAAALDDDGTSDVSVRNVEPSGVTTTCGPGREHVAAAMPVPPLALTAAVRETTTSPPAYSTIAPAATARIAAGVPTVAARPAPSSTTCTTGCRRSGT